MIYTSLDMLTPDTRDAAQRLIRELNANNITASVGETFRTQERQQKLFHSGKGVTKTLHSWHTVGRALDLDITPANEDTVSFFLETAANLGFRTMDKTKQGEEARKGGSVLAIWDWHHLEYRANKDYQTAYSDYYGKGRMNIAGLAGFILFFALGFALSYPKRG